MGKPTKQQINIKLQQSALEAKNKELQTQINVAKDTIVSQTKHIENLYSSFGLIIGILALMIVVFGIIAPMIMAFLSIKNKNELKKIKNNVDDFMSNKLEEWDKQGIKVALKKYLNGKISWGVFERTLKYYLPNYEEVNRILSYVNGGDSEFFLKCAKPFVTYLIENNKEFNQDDFKKIIRNLTKSKHFLELTQEGNTGIFDNVIKFLDPKEQEEMINSAINKENSSYSLFCALSTLSTCKLELPEIEKKVADEICENRDFKLVAAAQHYPKIVDLLISEGVLERMITLEYARDFAISKNSYLYEKLLNIKEYKEYYANRFESGMGGTKSNMKPNVKSNAKSSTKPLTPQLDEVITS